MKIKNFFDNLLYTRKGNIIIAIALPILFFSPILIIKIFSTEIRGLSSPCSFYEMTGFNCVGCGGTRCILNLLDFNFLNAIYYNPIFIAGFLLLAVVYIKFVIKILKKNYVPPTYNIRISTAIILPLIVVIFAIVRNFPFYRNFFY